VFRAEIWDGCGITGITGNLDYGVEIRKILELTVLAETIYEIIYTKNIPHLSLSKMKFFSQFKIKYDENLFTTAVTRIFCNEMERNKYCPIFK